MKAFLSYRSVDRDRVRSVAEALCAEGIDAWWDVWEIRPGDNFISKINEGLEQCDCGVVFLSNASLAGAWQQDEITILKTFAVDERRPLIPVLLDIDVKVPAMLRPYSRLSADQVAELADAIVHRVANKPALGTPRPVPACVRFTIHLRELPNFGIGVSAQLDGKLLVSEQAVKAGAGFAFSYSEFVKARPGGARQQLGESISASCERDLVRLGEAVGRVVFAGDIDRHLAECLTAGATGQVQEIELVFESASARMLSVPFEAARLADGRVPALMPGVFTWRRPPSANKTGAQAPSPGPLRIWSRSARLMRARRTARCLISNANWKPSSMPSKKRACTVTPMYAFSKSAVPIRSALLSKNSAITCSIFPAMATRLSWNSKMKTVIRF